MPLSDVTIRNAAPAEKHYKLSDSEGLYLFVRTSGAKLWRFRYMFHGREGQLSLGAYPLVTLKDARAKRDDARRLLDKGVDPGQEKKRLEYLDHLAANSTFGSISQEFLDKIDAEPHAVRTKTKTRWLATFLEADLGRRPITTIQPFEILTILKKIEKRGKHETAKRVRAYAARVFRYAVITGRAQHNPAADLGEALVTPRTKHYAAIVDPKGVGDLLRAIETVEPYSTVGLALRLAPHLFVRPGELRLAEWSEIRFDEQVWRIPAEKMKMRQEHNVPLSKQALFLLQSAMEIRTSSRFIFPSIRTNFRPMSDNTLNAALRRLGYSGDEMTAHGFRSTASTLLNESGLWSSDAIERALAHGDGDKIRAAYHRGTHWQERVRMAQWWSDYLDQLRDGAKVVALESARR